MNNMFMLFISLSFILFILEMLTPGTFFFFSFAIGTLVSSFIAFKVKDFSTLIIISSIVAIASYVLLRNFDIFNLKKIKSNSNMDSYIGKTAIVLSISEGNSCRVKVYSEEWNAICNTTVSIGDNVEIVGRDSLLLSVKKI